jgi:hypothetical protein
MVTMLLGGLWHGASFNFIVWGGMHGLALAFDKMRMSIASSLKFKVQSSKFVKLIGIIITFHFVCFCWIFFKASSFQDAGVIITQIFKNFNGAAWRPMLTAYGTVFGVMLMGYIIHFLPKSYEFVSIKVLSNISMAGRIAVLLVFIWIVIQIKQADQVMPIYLQF